LFLQQRHLDSVFSPAARLHQRPDEPVSRVPNLQAQTVGATGTPKAAILKNIGTEAVTIDGIGASGDFAQSNDCPASLAVGAYCIIDVVFKPSAAGIRSGAISIVDAVANSPQTLSLAGLGIAVP
jgi:hypothetical protein